jgi:hypothetical protein
MAFDVKRYKWLQSQKRWHAARDGKWHLSQYRYYAKQIRKMPGLLGYVVERAIVKRAPQLAANLTANNLLFARLRGICQI